MYDTDSVANEVFVIAGGVVQLSSPDSNAGFQVNAGQLFGQEVLHFCVGVQCFVVAVFIHFEIRTDVSVDAVPSSRFGICRR